MSGAEHLGPYLLEVKEGVFPLGGDSLALGAFATVKRGWRVCDLGTGSGCLLLMLAGREGGLSLTGVEREERAAQCARETWPTAAWRGRSSRRTGGQVTLPAGGFDLVISNPPYFQPGHGGDGGGARQADCSLEKLCRTAARLLRNRGRFALCHRPERLADLMCALRGAAWSPNGCGCWPWAGASPLLCSDGGGAPGAARSADRTVRAQVLPTGVLKNFRKILGPMQ